MEDNVKNILIEARRLIQDIGFCKGKMYYREESGHILAMCTIGAIIEAAMRLKSRHEYEARALFAKANAIDSISTPQWNDAPERSKQDVLSAFSIAIDACQ